MLKKCSWGSLIALGMNFVAGAQDVPYYTKGTQSISENQKSYYIKPEIGLWQSKSDVQAPSARYSTYGRYNAFTFGLIGGYQTKRLSIESGFRLFSIKTGFSMALTANDFIFHKASSNSYFLQIPVIFKLNIWKPSSKSAIYGLACIADNVNLDNDGVITPAIFTVRPSTISSSGQVITFNVARTFQSTPNFISGEFGVGFRWQIYRRIGTDLQVKRLFSANNINQLNATVSQLGDPTTDYIHSQNGTNGMAISFGLIYKIKSL